MQFNDEIKRFTRSLSSYYYNKYGQKVYKIPIHTKGSCPNRDGSIGIGGCAFCPAEGIGYQPELDKSPLEQYIEKSSRISVAHNASLFAVYFQNFTVTYHQPLMKWMHTLNKENVVEFQLSARPDCLDESLLKELKRFQQTTNKQIVFELGAQTVNEQVLKDMNRSHTLEDMKEAIVKLSSYGFHICLHWILNYPDVTVSDVKEAALFCNKYKVNRVKLQNLYISKGTKLYENYQKNASIVGTADDYLQRVKLFLSYLSPDIIVDRLFSRAHGNQIAFSAWGRNWQNLGLELIQMLQADGIYQGANCENGSCEGRS